LILVSFQLPSIDELEEDQSSQRVRLFTWPSQYSWKSSTRILFRRRVKERQKGIDFNHASPERIDEQGAYCKLGIRADPVRVRRYLARLSQVYKPPCSELR
jgi:hypothetical protein